MKKKLLAFGLILSMCMATLTGCSQEKDTTEKLISHDALAGMSKASLNFVTEGEDKYATVSENDRFALSINEDAYSIRVLDKKSGKVWNSCADTKGMEIRSKSNKAKLQSPFAFKSILGNKEQALTPLLANDYTVEFYKIDNGVRVAYDVEEYDFNISVDYILGEDGLTVNLPKDGVQENGKYSMVAIRLFQSFAAATDNTEGFYLYPDGSGAIMEFDDNSHYAESEVSYTVYNDIQDYKNAYNSIFQQAGNQVMLPVYGAAIEGEGFLAVMDKGAETAKVCIESTGDGVPTNKISCEFVYRDKFADTRYVTDEGKAEAFVFPTNYNNIERSITFRFLDSEEPVDYADMANNYREYLLDNGVAKLDAKDTIPLSLDLFMGIKEEGLMYDEFKTVTNFDQVEKILDKFTNEGRISNIQLQLEGWTKDGYFTEPNQFPVNSKIGGGSGLKSLLNYTKDKDISVALQANFLEARTDVGGYNERTDVMYLGNNTLLNWSTLCILSPTAIAKNYKSFTEDAKEYEGLAGVAFYSLGEYLSYNYNSSDMVSTTDCISVWQDMMKSSKETYGTSIVQGGNAYVLSVADKVTDIPYTDCGYQITTKSVPFYQMAVHGLVDYTGKAGNLSSDIQKETLKWIEYGYLPYFELTYDGSEDLMYTEYNTLFSSKYTDWLDEASSIYKDFNERFKDIRTMYMTDHEEVAENVSRVVYSDENKEMEIYVNYNDEAVTVNGVEIPAKSAEIK